MRTTISISSLFIYPAKEMSDLSEALDFRSCVIKYTRVVTLQAIKIRRFF